VDYPEATTFLTVRTIAFGANIVLSAFVMAGIAVRRTASLPLACVPAIHVLAAE